MKPVNTKHHMRSEKMVKYFVRNLFLKIDTVKRNKVGPKMVTKFRKVKPKIIYSLNDLNFNYY